jgi:dTDP-4-dehydrorhamnose 3,5-epimerase
MELRSLSIDGVYEIIADPRKDERGYFVRTYDRSLFERSGLVSMWEQESISFNRHADTIRGLHFQSAPHSETKIVRAVTGVLLDVIVDLRRASMTYGEWISLELSARDANAVYIPPGCAHGFRTLCPYTTVHYKMDSAYRPEIASGIRWDDRLLNIAWHCNSPVISVADRVLPLFADFKSPF